MPKIKKNFFVSKKLAARVYKEEIQGWKAPDFFNCTDKERMAFLINRLHFPGGSHKQRVYDCAVKFIASGLSDIYKQK